MVCEGRFLYFRYSINIYVIEILVIDGEWVFVYFGMFGFYCYDFEGIWFWEVDFGDYDLCVGWGILSFFVLFEDWLII